MRENDNVLDVACGTGIIGRTIFERVSPATPICGVDSNPSMVSLAREITKDNAKSFSWQVANSENLPFSGGSFTRVFCQQGFQYFENAPPTAKEMFRVLKSKGLLAASVWVGHGSFFRIFADAVGQHVSHDLKVQMLAPDLQRLLDDMLSILLSAGFSKVSSVDLDVYRTVEALPKAIRLEILGHPVGNILEQSGKLEIVAETILSRSEAFSQGTEFKFPQTARLFLAQTS